MKGVGSPHLRMEWHDDIAGQLDDLTIQAMASLRLRMNSVS